MPPNWRMSQGRVMRASEDQRQERDDGAPARREDEGFGTALVDVTCQEFLLWSHGDRVVIAGNSLVAPQRVLTDGRDCDLLRMHLLGEIITPS